jgi:hypothetical protein
MPSAFHFLCKYVSLTSVSLRKLFSLVILATTVLLVASSGLQLSAAATEPNPSKSTAALHPTCSMVYAGFVGALETSNHKGSGVVQIRDTLQGADYPDVCAASFIPISWTSGRDWILTHFPSHPGPLTGEEATNSPRVILVGHSTGGWAMLSVARALRARNIPVELTVQIDSVGVTDATIPKNVRYSAIFHAWDALVFMTTKSIRLEDPNHTTIVANVVVKDASHLSITRDPRIKELVLNSVKTLRSELAARNPPLQPSTVAGTAK